VKPIRPVLLLLRFPPEFAGGGLQASRLMAALASRGVEPTVLTAVPEGTAGAAAPRRERVHGCDVVRFSLPGRRLVRDLALGIRAAAWLVAHPCWDLLHVSGWSWFGLPPLLVARLFRRPVVLKTTLLGTRGAFDPSGGRVGAWLLAVHRRVDVIVTLSQALEEDLRARPGLRARTLRIPNGVDVLAFRPAQGAERMLERDAFDLPRDAFVVVTCGMLSRRKNVAALVRAAGRTAVRPLVVALVGPRGDEPDYQAELDAAIAALPAGVEARCLGELPPPALAGIQRAADVFVLVSRAEGLPNSLLEAMATGLPCVATRIPGSADVLAEGGGRLVPLDDEAALASLLDELARDPEARSRLGAEARAKILERHSFERIAERYLELYASLLERRA